MKLVSGNSNIPLSQDIAKYLGVELVKATIKKFPDKEIFVEITLQKKNHAINLIHLLDIPY